MTVVNDFIESEIAGLTREIAAPDPNAVGFGSDLDCVTDCTDDFAELDPFSPLGIAQACVRRLYTPRGGLPDEPDYGLYLPGYVNRGVTQNDLRDLNGLIVGELRRDDRISDLTVALSYSAITKTLGVSCQITPDDPSLGTFTFTFSVTDSRVLLETIT